MSGPQQHTQMLQTLSNEAANSIWIYFIVLTAFFIATYCFTRRYILNPISSLSYSLKPDDKQQPVKTDTHSGIHEIHMLEETYSSLCKRIEDSQRHIEYLTSHDTVTALANREQFLKN